ncbi:hypothetical protein GCM10023321_08180 [Pseudonocardia eucalypti]|uniref:CBS domain-containing protein n=1 Tax=Pseudonocardia eucalypti TaxID=648755 RepID=A0ABP9PKU5_9PSEU|nr:CBS-domain-containing membrane protein [Pseudonocardia eucalypti]
MTRRVIAARAQTPIARAVQLLVGHRFSAVPVVDEHNRLIGILSTADLLRELHNRRALLHDTVGAVMNTEVLYMSPEANVGVLAHRLRTYGDLRVMPIVEHDVLVGVVTRADLLRHRPRGGKLGRLALRCIYPFHAPTRPPLAPDLASRPAGHLAGAGRDLVVASTDITPGAGTTPLRARDVMTSSGLVTVTEQTPTEQAARLLINNRFTALPVVDRRNHLVGIISEADLVHDPLDARRTAHSPTVGGAMTSDVLACSPDTDFDELCRLLSDGGLATLPIVEHDQIVGIVSRADLLRHQQHAPG